MEKKAGLVASVVIFFILLFLYSKFGPSIPVSILSQTKGEPLVVQGTGTVAVAPDIAKLTVGVEDTGTSLKTVQNSVNQKSQKLVDALKKLGISDKDIKTTSYNIFPETRPVPVPLSATVAQPAPSGIRQYRVSITYEVTIRDFDKVDDALTAVTGAGANLISGITFDVNDDTKDKKMTEARQLAVKDARQKAQSLASAAGVSLGKLINISESSGPRPIPLVAQGGGTGQAETTTPNIQPGESEFTVTVTLSYDIR